MKCCWKVARMPKQYFDHNHGRTWPGAHEKTSNGYGGFCMKTISALLENISVLKITAHTHTNVHIF